MKSFRKIVAERTVAVLLELNTRALEGGFSRTAGGISALEQDTLIVCLRSSFLFLLCANAILTKRCNL